MNRRGKENFNNSNFNMNTNFLEGLIKPEVKIATDMSKETSDTNVTYNQPIYININTLVVDKELGDKIVELLCRRQHTAGEVREESPQ